MISYEKLLEKFLSAVAMLPAEERDAFRYFDAAGGAFKNVYVSGQALAEIAHDLRAAIAEQAEKSAGRGSAQKAMQRIAKRSPRKNMRCAWTQDGKQYVCDGAVAIELNAPIAGLPAPEFDLAPFDAARAIDLASPNNGAVLPVPSLSALKTHIKASRAELKAAGKKSNCVPLDFGEELPLMNAQILADVLEIIPDATFTASSRSPEFAPVYFEGAAGRGCVMPLRKRSASAA